MTGTDRDGDSRVRQLRPVADPYGDVPSFAEVAGAAGTDGSSALQANVQPPGGWNTEERAEIERLSVTDSTAPTKFIPGGSFVLDAPDKVPAVWGRGDEVFWARGEAIMICGPSGVGKTTVAGQLIAGRLGLLPRVLGYPVEPSERTVLYLAMDRPQQAARALRRVFTPAHRELLDQRLIVWKGPPPYDMAKRTDVLAMMCERADADTVVVDSIKDAALGLSDDEVGASYNRARQKAITAGVEIIELHHQRKAGTNGGAPNTINDVYGSVWLPNGAGSVIVLWGSPGDSVVQLIHLKQPAETIGPLQVLHDHNAGISSVFHSTDLLAVVRRSPHGLTAKEAACAMFETDKPKANEVEKARRKLDSLAKSGLLMCKEGSSGGARGGSPSTYHDASAMELEMPG